MRADIASARIGGAAVYVCQEREDGGRIEYSAAFGKRNTDTGEDMTADTVFRLASMTKPVTVTALLLLLERGLLSLSDPVSRYLPAFEGKAVGRVEGGAAVADHLPASPLTVRHLLTHTAGLGTWDPVAAAQKGPTGAARRDLASAVDFYARRFLFAFDPGCALSYSPTAGFDIAARIAEVTAGVPYADFLRENILSPLGMTDTAYVPSEDAWHRMSAMYDLIDGRCVPRDMGRHTFEDLPLTYTSGGAGLTSTVADYAKFCRMLLAEGAYPGGRLLSPETLSLMHTPQIPDGIPGTKAGETWGLGVRIVRSDPALAAGCYGWSGAYGTHFWIDPVDRLFAIYMKNSLFDGGANAGTARAFERCVAASLVG